LILAAHNTRRLLYLPNAQQNLISVDVAFRSRYRWLDLPTIFYARIIIVDFSSQL